MNLSPSLSYEEIFNQLRLAEGDCMAIVVLAGQQKLETGMRDSAASCLLSPPLLIVNVVTSCCCCHRLRRAQTETDRERLVISYYLQGKVEGTDNHRAQGRLRWGSWLCSRMFIFSVLQSDKKHQLYIMFSSPSSYTGYELLRLQREHWLGGVELLPRLIVNCKHKHVTGRLYPGSSSRLITEHLDSKFLTRVFQQIFSHLWSVPA